MKVDSIPGFKVGLVSIGTPLAEHACTADTTNAATPVVSCYVEARTEEMFALQADFEPNSALAGETVVAIVELDGREALGRSIKVAIDQWTRIQCAGVTSTRDGKAMFQRFYFNRLETGECSPGDIWPATDEVCQMMATLPGSPKRSRRAWELCR